MRNNKLNGSGILVVIISSVVFYIYTMSTFSEGEYYSILQKKYEDDIVKEYEKNYNNIEDYYNKLLELRNIKE